MKLLLDLGNSRVKWAWWSAEGLVGKGCARHRNHDLVVMLGDALLGAPTPDEVRVANVAGPAAGARLAELIVERFGITAVFARSCDAAHGLRNGYIDPGQLGVDRWLAMCAAWRKFPGPLCVVDAGTAVTVDIIAADGVHAGGLIVPGIELMVAALLQKTADLHRAAGSDVPEIRFEGRHLMGLDTASGIELGVARTLVALVADCVTNSGVGAVEPKLIITGGDGARLARLLGGSAMYLPDLVLEGLALDPVCYSVA
jgi:type III pantothenate kinase